MVKKIIKSIFSILLCFFIAVGTFPVCAAGKTKPNSVGGKATVWFIFVNFREEACINGYTAYWYNKNK